MLESELSGLQNMISDADKSITAVAKSPHFFNKECVRIRKAWSAASFSDAGEVAFSRYLNFHLKGILALSDTLSSSPRVAEMVSYQNDLTDLLDYLLYYFKENIDQNVLLPQGWCQRYLISRYTLQQNFENEITGLSISKKLKSCLTEYLSYYTSDRRFTLGELNYYEEFLEALSSGKQESMNDELWLNEKLAKLDFNHFKYLHYLQYKIKEEIESANFAERDSILNSYKSYYRVLPEHLRRYDRQWPSLKTILSGWLDEIAVKPDRGFTKLPLDVPVSHLAFLTRLFHEEGFFGGLSLTCVFKFMTTAYSSKRQLNISPGSFSKEFYSADQQTAARVRDLLQKMINRINRNFFPAVAVLSAACHFSPGIQ